MAANMANVALTAALCLMSAAGAFAQAMMPARPSLDGNNGTFANLNATQFKFTFALPPKKESRTTGNTAPALGPAGFGSRLFALAPCTLFLPHFHPGAAEYFLGIKGKINLVAYINQKLVKNEILASGVDSVIVPINTFHYFYNAQCEPAAVISSLNSATPGFQGYYNLTRAITDTDATADDVQFLIDSRAPNATLDVTRTFFDLTTNCLRKCSKKNNNNKKSNYKNKKYSDDDDRHDDDDYYYKNGQKYKMMG